MGRLRGDRQRLAELVHLWPGRRKCYDGTPGSLTLTYWDWAGYDRLPKLDGSLAAVRNYIYASGSGS